MSMTPEAMAAATGVCTISGINVNIRSAPSTNADKVGALTQGQQMPVTGQSVDGNGITWYQIQGGWVRSEVVIIAGDCSTVPPVSA